MGHLPRVSIVQTSCPNDLTILNSVFYPFAIPVERQFGFQPVFHIFAPCCRNTLAHRPLTVWPVFHIFVPCCQNTSATGRSSSSPCFISSYPFVRLWQQAVDRLARVSYLRPPLLEYFGHRPLTVWPVSHLRTLLSEYFGHLRSPLSDYFGHRPLIIWLLFIRLCPLASSFCHLYDVLCISPPSPVHLKLRFTQNSGFA